MATRGGGAARAAELGPIGKGPARRGHGGAVHRQNLEMTFLAPDGGNTRLKGALHDAARPGARVLAQGAVFLENIEKLAEKEWQGLEPPQHILGCIVAGDPVKRRVMDQTQHWATALTWAITIPSSARTTNGYDHTAPPLAHRQ